MREIDQGDIGLCDDCGEPTEGRFVRHLRYLRVEGEQVRVWCYLCLNCDRPPGETDADWLENRGIDTFEPPVLRAVRS